MNSDTLNQPVGPTCPVSSFNEWDPLEEVIVGSLDGATIPPYHVTVTLNVPSFTGKLHRLVAGHRFPKWMVKLAQADLDEFIGILKGENIIVRRPDAIKHSARYKTANWSSKGFCVACPRDGYLVIGDEIIEAPMCWRSRHFEGDAYRSLFKEYFNAGARWTSAPRPMLTDDIYDSSYTIPEYGETMRYIVTEFEPVFDAADFVRCGRDLFVTRSNVTNLMGIEWLRRHLGDKYRVHEIPSKCRQPMHIDSTFMPLAPGRVLVNPDYCDIDNLPAALKDWEILVAPRPDPTPGIMNKISMCSAWTSINVLSLDEKKIVVERCQTTLIKQLKDWGFDPIPCNFASYGPFGGAFHCATLDVRRRGTLQNYC
ncbi:amidinotransferase [Paramagnetospirillum kuznetsovii]|uniref:Amidinotransferase n=1 Tax=Paramagnetospirillum kuznetsovii TaxID=2053833 RepID=A0A364NU92_9PROT|nr:amidinotransferase [Paramagnetospirillum kuznetsovii]RAU20447.1 amidinotransferase [Paramagnetospirillum kuznetsovii]